MAYEEEIRNISNRLRDEEQKKSALMTRNHDQKLKSFEEAKEGLNRRLQEYMRLVQEKDRQIHEMEHGV